jgi:kynurenine aminotransferase
MPSLKQALSETYSPIFGRTIDPDLEISVTAGASAGLLSGIMAFVEPGEEVIVLEPVFNASAYNSSIDFKVFAADSGCRYVYYVELAGGIVRYVPLHPPPDTESKPVSSNEWKLDLQELEAAISPKTKMMVRFSFPLFKTTVVSPHPLAFL